jgi:hypothetical protein
MSYDVKPFREFKVKGFNMQKAMKVLEKVKGYPGQSRPGSTKPNVIKSYGGIGKGTTKPNAGGDKTKFKVKVAKDSENLPTRKIRFTQKMATARYHATKGGTVKAKLGGRY